MDAFLAVGEKKKGNKREAGSISPGDDERTTASPAKKAKKAKKKPPSPPTERQQKIFASFFTTSKPKPVAKGAPLQRRVARGDLSTAALDEDDALERALREEEMKAMRLLRKATRALEKEQEGDTPVAAVAALPPPAPALATTTGSQQQQQQQQQLKEEEDDDAPAAAATTTVSQQQQQQQHHKEEKEDDDALAATTSTVSQQHELKEEKEDDDAPAAAAATTATVRPQQQQLKEEKEEDDDEDDDDDDVPISQMMQRRSSEQNKVEFVPAKAILPRAAPATEKVEFVTAKAHLLNDEAPPATTATVSSQQQQQLKEEEPISRMMQDGRRQSKVEFVTAKAILPRAAATEKVGFVTAKAHLLRAAAEKKAPEEPFRDAGPVEAEESPPKEEAAEEPPKGGVKPPRQRQTVLSMMMMMARPPAAKKPPPKAGPHARLLAAPDPSDPLDTSTAARLAGLEGPVRRPREEKPAPLLPSSSVVTMSDDDLDDEALVACCDLAIAAAAESAKLSAEQRAVAEAGFDKATLVVAGAGTGKTYTMVRRVCEMVQAGLPSYAILLVTFTNKACQELRDRLAEALPEMSQHDLPTVKTFHGLANSWVKRYWRTLGFSGRPTPLTTEAAQRKLMLRVLQLKVVEPKRLARASRSLGLVSKCEDWEPIVGAFEAKRPKHFLQIKAEAVELVKAQTTAAKKRKKKKQKKGVVEEEEEEEEAESLAKAALRDEIARGVYLACIKSARPAKKTEALDDLAKKWLCKATAGECLKLISDGRAKGHEPAEYLEEDREIWVGYEALLKRESQIEFDAMLHEFCGLLKNCGEARRRFSEAHSWLIVDEYQDNCKVQTDILFEMVGANERVTVVGDDDQSIYGFRGAELGNFERFESHFQGARRYRLTGNYRSTARILKAAASVLERAHHRPNPKLLEATRVEGEEVCLFQCEDDRHQATKVVDAIEEYCEKGATFGDCCILLRCFNFGSYGRLHSRLQEEMAKRGVPMRIVGGKPTLATAMALDIASYLSLAQREDSAAFHRVFNVPPRRLSPKVFEALEHLADSQSVTLEKAATTIVGSDLLKPAQRMRLADFLGLINDLRERAFESDAAAMVDAVWDLSGFAQRQADLDEREKSKAANDDDEEEDEEEEEESEEEEEEEEGSCSSKEPPALVAMRAAATAHVEEWQSDHPLPAEQSLFQLATRVLLLKTPERARTLPWHLRDLLSSHLAHGPSALQSFTDKLALHTAEDETTSQENKVLISTIHRAKGLEWPFVLVPFLNEGIMPTAYKEPKAKATRHLPTCPFLKKKGLAKEEEKDYMNPSERRLSATDFLTNRNSTPACACHQHFAENADVATRRHEDEERRLAHVAATRARDLLHFYSVSSMYSPKEKKPIDQDDSPFLADLETRGNLKIVDLRSNANDDGEGRVDYDSGDERFWQD